MSAADEPGLESVPVRPQLSWRDFARRRQTVWDGWIAVSLLLMPLGAVGMITSVHTDGGAPIQSAWPLVFGADFVLQCHGARRDPGRSGSDHHDPGDPRPPADGAS